MIYQWNSQLIPSIYTIIYFIIKVNKNHIAHLIRSVSESPSLPNANT